MMHNIDVSVVLCSNLHPGCPTASESVPSSTTDSSNSRRGRRDMKCRYRERRQKRSVARHLGVGSTKQVICCCSLESTDRAMVNPHPPQAEDMQETTSIGGAASPTSAIGPPSRDWPGPAKLPETDFHCVLALGWEQVGALGGSTTT